MRRSLHNATGRCLRFAASGLDRVRLLRGFIEYLLAFFPWDFSNPLHASAFYQLFVLWRTLGYFLTSKCARFVYAFASGSSSGQGEANEAGREAPKDGAASDSSLPHLRNTL